MKALFLVTLLAQLSPTSTEDLIRGNVTVIETPAIEQARGPVEQWLGRKLIVFEGTSPTTQPLFIVFPSQQESNEALITPSAVFVPKAKFLEFRSGFELAEFLSHAGAHAKLGHAQKWTQTVERAASGSGNTVDLLKARKELEDEAESTAPQFLEQADCGPGPCSRFGRLLAAVRR
jgi:hypothetical protein